MPEPRSLGQLPVGESTELHGELDALMRECARPGWDGHGAEPVSREAWQAAERFIDALPKNIPPPSLSADPDGCVTFEWGSSRERTLLVSVQPQDGLDYAALIGQATAHGWEPFYNEFPEALESLLQRVLRACVSREDFVRNFPF